MSSDVVSSKELPTNFSGEIQKMSEDNIENKISEEVTALRQKFENLKSQTEDFVTSAKHLSETGVHGAKEILESAKENWQTILSTFGGAKISGLFSKAKKSAAPKKAKKAASKSVKKVVKKLKKKKKK
jgi:hypothetical protein